MKNCGGVDILKRDEATATSVFTTQIAANHPLHGHHVVPKEASGDAGKKAARAARNILCRRGINPFTGCENLAFTPNYGGHPDDYAKFALRKLKTVENLSRSRVEGMLRHIAEQYAFNTWRTDT